MFVGAEAMKSDTFASERLYNEILSGRRIEIYILTCKCVAALDNSFERTTTAQWLASLVTNVRDSGSNPGARSPIFLP